VPLGGDPAGVTKTWKDGPEAGAGVQLNAHPMFQPAAVVVNGVLVQLPCCCGESKSWRAGPADDVDGVVGVVVVDPPATVVVLDPAAVVVVVEELPPGAVVVVTALPPVPVPAGIEFAGSFPCPEPAVFALDAPPPVSPLIHIPAMTAIRTAVRSCQVFQLLRSFIFRSPGLGTSPDDDGGVAVFVRVMGWASRDGAAIGPHSVPGDVCSE
jgi:hypothetical protein